MGVDPSTDTIYVANQTDNTVSVINGATNTVTAVIGVGADPDAVGVNPSTDTIYVASAGGINNPLAVIDGATNTFSVYSLPRGPGEIAVDPSTDTIYVSNPYVYAGIYEVMVIDGATPNESTEIAVGKTALGIGVDPSTDIIYVANQSDNTVSVIDGETSTVISTIGVGTGPDAVGVDPSTNIIYVANRVDDTVSVITGTGTSNAVNTTTTLTALPSPATAGSNVTLTADVTAADGSSPAGSVQFTAGTTAIGSPVTVTGGIASTTTTFAAAGPQSLSAVFTPANTAVYNSSSGPLSLTVQSGATSGALPLATTVPAVGSLSLTVAPSTVTLAVSGANAAGTLSPVTVTDTRNTYPGWSVSGQAGDFAGSGSAAGSAISGSQLGWVPTDTSLATGAALGPTVAPATPGLGGMPGILASAAAGGGLGTSLLGANLTLAIPPTAAAGPYASTLTVTAVAALS